MEKGSFICGFHVLRQILSKFGRSCIWNIIYFGSILFLKEKPGNTYRNCIKTATAVLILYTLLATAVFFAYTNSSVEQRNRFKAPVRWIVTKMGLKRQTKLKNESTLIHNVDLSIVDEEDLGDCVYMYTRAGTTPICLYKDKKDCFISASLRKGKRWENHNVELMEKIFLQDKDIHLLDIGAHIGVYTITALKLGRNVVSVDPNVENIRRIRRSAQLGNLCHNMILLLNAVDNRRHPVKMAQNIQNVGGQSILEESQNTSDSVKAILMDDLIPIIPFRKIFLKIDIETKEIDALSKARKLFDEKDIQYMLMEWNYIKTNGTTELISFLRSKGYEPYEPTVHPFKPLSNVDPKYWTFDVLWKKVTN